MALKMNDAMVLKCQPVSVREAAKFALPDGRAFYLKADMAVYAVELARALNATIRIVEVPAATRLAGLRRLAAALSSPDYKTPKIFERDLGPFHGEVARLTRAQVAAKSKEVRDHIRSQLLSGKGVSMKGLAERFVPLGYTRPSLKHHLSTVRQEGSSEVGTVCKVGQEYFLTEKK